MVSQFWEWISKLSPPQASFFGTVVGSGLGFASLALGALFNFRLNRRRDALLRSDEADAVTAALYGEMTVIRRELARTATIVAKTEMHHSTYEKHFPELVQLPEPMIYRALAGRLGLLRPEWLLPIAEFYTNVELVRVWVPRLVKPEDRRFEYHPLSVLDPALNAIKIIEPVMLAMSVRLRFASAPETLDLVHITDIAEDQRDMLENPPQRDGS